MRIAVIAVTKKGIEKGEEVEKLLINYGHQVMFYVPGKYSLLKLPGHRMPFRKPLREIMTDLMGQYEALVCIMALGIVVRLIAPNLRDKKSDPAVVVMDELGQNIISVLSGHWGGANDLTREIAAGLSANPVITTATDVRGLPAIEMLAKDKGWSVEPFTVVRKINAAIVNADRVELYCDDVLDMNLPQNFVQLPVSQYNFRDSMEKAQVVVTNKVMPTDSADTLFLRPKNIIVGIGCRRGVSKDNIKAAVLAAFTKAEVAIESVREFASVELKSGEPGLLELANEWVVPVTFFSTQEIQELYNRQGQKLSAGSPFVKEQIGVDGVCEPTALLAAGEQGRLILPKITLGGVTVAIAEAVYQW